MAMYTRGEWRGLCTKIYILQWLTTTGWRRGADTAPPRSQACSTRLSSLDGTGPIQRWCAPCKIKREWLACKGPKQGVWQQQQLDLPGTALAVLNGCGRIGIVVDVHGYVCGLGVRWVATIISGIVWLSLADDQLGYCFLWLLRVHFDAPGWAVVDHLRFIRDCAGNINQGYHRPQARIMINVSMQCSELWTPLYLTVVVPEDVVGRLGSVSNHARQVERGATAQIDRGTLHNSGLAHCQEQWKTNKNVTNRLVACQWNVVCHCPFAYLLRSAGWTNWFWALWRPANKQTSPLVVRQLILIWANGETIDQ